MAETQREVITYTPEQQYDNSVVLLRGLLSRYEIATRWVANLLAWEDGQRQLIPVVSGNIQSLWEQIAIENTNIQRAHESARRRYYKKHGTQASTVEVPDYRDFYLQSLQGNRQGWKNLTELSELLAMTDLDDLAAAFQLCLSTDKQREIELIRQRYDQVAQLIEGIPDLNNEAVLRPFLQPTNGFTLPLSPLTGKAHDIDLLYTSPRISVYAARDVIDAGVHNSGAIFNIPYHSHLSKYQARLDAVAARILTAPREEKAVA